MIDGDQGRLVVVGASAGGIDALGELVSNLPADFSAAIVVAQHLDPRRPSHLADILARRSTLPVRPVADKETLAPGVVYIVPADRTVEILDGTVSVRQEPRSGRPTPSVDRLFQTAAQAYGENLIAVVLSGAGSDGTEGARLVKAGGGTVVIQDPTTARFPSMPQSLAPTTVDVVAPIDAMGRILGDLVQGDGGPASADEHELLPRFLRQVREQTGIDFSQYKEPTIMRRLRRRMAAVRVSTLPEYVRYAARTRGEYEKLASTFLIKVTEFFRDKEIYQYLASQVMPQLAADAATRDQELRIWSAGCATGEEAYSLAIVVAEALGDARPGTSVRIFATDLDNDAITFARRGIYSRAAIGDMSEDLIDRYFIRVGEEFEVRKNIRAITVFGQHDLAQRAPFPRIDLAMSRNVLIYFTPELQRRALQLFAFSVREGGYLVLGKAESVTPMSNHFTLEEPRFKIYRRHGDRVLIPSSRGMAMSNDLAQMSAAQTRRPNEPLRRPREPRTSANRADQVLMRLPFGVVSVSTAYEILTINTAARQMLGIRGEAVGEDFVHAAREVPSNMLRGGIDRARSGESSTTTVDLEGVGRGVPRALEIQFLARRSDAEGDTSDAVVVVVTDQTAQAEEMRRHQSTAANLGDEALTMRRQIEGLEGAHVELVRANLELTAANADLRGANEELLVGSEEVQAATEEVETLNEELQATNEELETLNEELQATVEELNTTNDDLEARGVELEDTVANVEEQRRLIEAEQARVTRLLLDPDRALMVIDSERRVVLANATWQRLDGPDRQEKFVREDEGRETTLGELVDELLPTTERAEAMTVTLLGSGPRGGRLRYELKAEPLTDEKGKVKGSLLTLNPRRS